MFNSFREHIQTGIVQVVSEQPDTNKSFRTVLQLDGDVINFASGSHVFEDKDFIAAHFDKVDKAYSESAWGGMLVKHLPNAGVITGLYSTVKSWLEVAHLSPAEMLEYLSWQDWTMAGVFAGSFFLKKVLIKIVLMMK